MMTCTDDTHGEEKMATTKTIAHKTAVGDIEAIKQIRIPKDIGIGAVKGTDTRDATKIVTKITSLDDQEITARVPTEATAAGRGEVSMHRIIEIENLGHDHGLHATRLTGSATHHARLDVDHVVPKVRVEADGLLNP